MEQDPYRTAIVELLDDDLKEELTKAEAQFRLELADALAAKGRATDFIRTGNIGRAFEHLEAELETEHTDLVRYHSGKLAKKVRWIVEAWADQQE
jgi:hypothetical protein